MKQNRHVIVDPKTNIVRNIVLWDGAEWLPPQGYIVFPSHEGQIGDRWDEEKGCFYTSTNKKRYIDSNGKAGEILEETV